MLGVTHAMLLLGIIFAILGAPLGALVVGVIATAFELWLFIRAGL